MERYKEEFIEFMIASKVLKFGSFTLKSGRVSPFFMNAGAYVTGGQIRKLGAFYARAMGWSLMFSLDRPTKEFLLRLQLPAPSASCTERKSAIVPTVRKQRTMEIREFC